MNDILQNIMTFINENTILLICICVFLILALIGYLIDNSVKSKRVRNDIKNADQVPENIKEEIIKEAKKEDKIDDSLVNTTENQNAMNTLNTVEAASDEVNATLDFSNPDSNAALDLNSASVDSSLELNSTPVGNSLDLNSTQTDTTLNLDGGLTLDSTVSSSDTQLDLASSESTLSEPLSLENTDLNASLDLDNTNTSLNIPLETTEPLTQEITQPVEDNIVSMDAPVEDTNAVEQTDPDAAIMQNVEVSTSGYSNDKKLSEILLGMNNIDMSKKESNDIFETQTPNIEVNSEVSKDDVQIETPASPTDELDNIMRKLSSANNEIQDDNYTNIF